MKQPQPPRQPADRHRSRARSSLADRRVAVLGLGGIGRQVALQLAALGVGRLLLIDAGRVSSRNHLPEGFCAEDIGRPKVHVAAQLCHQINPRLDIRTLQSRSLRGLDLGDAVFCCSVANWARQANLRSLLGGIGFYAAADVYDERLYLPIVSESLENVLEQEDLLPPWGRVTRRGPLVCPLHVASIAAGLLVAEFVRFVRGKSASREIHLNLRTLNLTLIDFA